MNRDAKSKVSRDLRHKIRYRKDRTTKRKQPLNPAAQDKVEVEANISRSAKKLKSADNHGVAVNNDIDYVFLNFETVFAYISDQVKCKKCGSNVTFAKSSTRGLGFRILISCAFCQPKSEPSCSQVRSEYEINRRFILAMRLIGVGFGGASKFCGVMDLPPPLSRNAYRAVVDKIETATEVVCDAVLRKSVQEEQKLTIEATETIPEGLTVSGDGTWHKRGFNSLFGVSSIIGHYSGKVVDLVTKSKFCKKCEIWKGKEDSAEYADFWSEHEAECTANHEGSSGKMEVDAVREMFCRSEEKYGVKYLNYIGDGDSKTFKGIVDDPPYPNIKKKECVGHVQKRMGTRLRTCKSKNKGLGGRGKLTGALIDKLTIYYGLAIRRNCESIEKMRNAIQGTLLHMKSTDKKPQHKWCPEGAESWCSYQKARALKDLKNYRHKPPLHPDVEAAIGPIYKDLSDNGLLERCVGGFTQNSNESFNNLIWRIAPKNLNTGSSTINIAANTAVCTFNEGTRSLLRIMDQLDIRVGRNVDRYCDEIDMKRVSTAELRAKQATREGRIVRRQARLTQEDAEIATEGVLYGPGIDD